MTTNTNTPKTADVGYSDMRDGCHVCGGNPRPKLIPRGKWIVCEKCGGSYGEATPGNVAHLAAAPQPEATSTEAPHESECDVYAVYDGPERVAIATIEGNARYAARGCKAPRIVPSRLVPIAAQAPTAAQAGETSPAPEGQGVADLIKRIDWCLELVGIGEYIRETMVLARAALVTAAVQGETVAYMDDKGDVIRKSEKRNVSTDGAYNNPLVRRGAAVQGDASSVLPTFTREGCMRAAENELQHGDIAWPMGGATPAPAAPGPAASSAVPWEAPPCWWMDFGTHGHITMDAAEVERRRPDAKRVIAYMPGAAASPALAPEQSQKSLLRKVGERPTVCYCPPGVCNAPKGFSGPCNRVEGGDHA